ncbi:hypothetical protein [Streptomyces sp. NBC_00035]|uniref:hypothetical protein n=1 Tax=Streptomyces sp. NBC_00035 TaxID=2903614 RepID=UPI0032433E1F
MERTQPDPVDVGLRVLLEQPSYAAQVLITLARLLEMDYQQPVNGLALERAMDIAADTVLRPLPDVVTRDSLTRAYAAMPPTAGISRGEYALRLRAAAKELG